MEICSRLYTDCEGTNSTYVPSFSFEGATVRFSLIPSLRIKVQAFPFLILTTLKKSDDNAQPFAPIYLFNRDRYSLPVLL